MLTSASALIHQARFRTQAHATDVKGVACTTAISLAARPAAHMATRASFLPWVWAEPLPATYHILCDLGHEHVENRRAPPPLGLTHAPHQIGQGHGQRREPRATPLRA